ncbi:MAG: methyltransferase domain-containing protein [Opitutales bacterium]
MSDVVERTEKYYDSADADNFYFRIWGGEDLHIGIYESPEDTIRDASVRTVERMAAKIKDRPAGSKLLDLGAGFGGSCRWLARNLGLQCVALNLSKVQNDRDRKMNADQGLADKVDVVDGNFEQLPFGDAEFDLVWSQDSILHSGDRRKVFEEANRVLKPGGEIVFTDPMQKPDADQEALQPVLNRIHLETMGSFEKYEAFAQDLGWELIERDDLSPNLPRHYATVRAELDRRAAEIGDDISQEYLGNMKRGLDHWVAAGEKGLLTWGILHFRKPSA